MNRIKRNRLKSIFKKFVVVSLTFILLASLYGCGTNKSSEKDTSDSKEKQEGTEGQLENDEDGFKDMKPLMEGVEVGDE